MDKHEQQLRKEINDFVKKAYAQAVTKLMKEKNINFSIEEAEKLNSEYVKTVT